MELNILNFKGIDKMELKFDRAVQNIWGANGTGKTSIADAISFLYFGKNSLGKTDFGIKPLNPDNTRKDHTDVEVSGIIIFNDRKVHLKHRFIEKWQKIKGSTEPSFTGNTHEYFVDNAPYSEAEYKEYINRIIDEDIFPLITNPLEFPRMPWEKQRMTLLQVAGDVSNEDLVKAYPELKTLVDRLLNKTLSKFKEEVVANKKLCKDEMDGIPTRIDETRRGMPDEIDHEAISAGIKSREASLAAVEDEILDANKAGEGITKKIQEHQSLVRRAKLDRDQLADRIRADRRTEDAEDKREIKQKNVSLDQLAEEIANRQNAFDRCTTREKELIKQIEEGREAWVKVNAEKLDIKPDELCCPTCKQDLPEETREEKQADLKKNFEKDKALRIKRIADRGIGMSQELAEVQQTGTKRVNEIAEMNKRYDELVEEIRVIEDRPAMAKPDIEKVISEDVQYIFFTEDINSLEANAPKQEPKDLTAQRQRQYLIRNEIDGFKKILSTKDQRVKDLARIDELKKQEKDLANKLHEWEHLENLIQQFTKIKIDTLTDRINDRFQMVKFKMFNYLQNGGVKETCEMTVNGVPYSDLNTAGRINAGIDLINVLSAHYEVIAPITIDNRESIVDIIYTRSQVINLIVREGVSPLYVGKHPPAVKARQEQLAL